MKLPAFLVFVICVKFDDVTYWVVRSNGQKNRAYANRQVVVCEKYYVSKLVSEGVVVLKTEDTIKTINRFNSKFILD